MPNYSLWIPKKQAADIIGISTKTLEDLVKQRKVQMAMYRRPEGGPKIAVCHPDDVERERKERNPEGAPFVLPARPTAAEIEAILPDQANHSENSEKQSPLFSEMMHTAQTHLVLADMSRLVVKLLEAPRELPLAELAHKMYLTIEEARRYTGLSRELIQRAGKQRKVHRVGRVYKRTDLEKL